MSGLKAYLAHPYDKRKSTSKYKIKKTLEERGVEVVDPFKGEYVILRKHGVKEYYSEPKYKMARELWIKDLQEIKDCDMLVAWVPDDENCRGTCVEIYHAYLHKKFIQIISPARHPSFAYVLTGGNQMFESIEDFVKLRVLR